MKHVACWSYFNQTCTLGHVIYNHHTGFVQEVYLAIRDDNLPYKRTPHIASGRT